VGTSGAVGDSVLGDYSNPFEEWPEEVKQYWIYNPEGAEKLLDDAGFPRGADGMRFKLPIVAISGYSETGYLEIVEAYLQEIGIDAYMEPMDQPTWNVARSERNWDGLGMGFLGLDYPPASRCKSPTKVSPFAEDSVQEAMHQAVNSATTFAEEEVLVKACDWHMILKHEVIWGPKVPQYLAAQPWIVGYNGEQELSVQSNGPAIYARLWIDQELKKAMGR
jgi:hypothetical protein